MRYGSVRQNLLKLHVTRTRLLTLYGELVGAFRFPEDKLSLINRTVDLGNNRTLKPWHDGKGGYQ